MFKCTVLLASALIGISPFLYFHFFATKNIKSAQGSVTRQELTTKNLAASNDIPKKTPPRHIHAKPLSFPVPILMYHHIREFNDPRKPIDTNLSVPPSNFKAQMDYLKNNGYKTITLDQLYSDDTLPSKPVVVTFDDGYQDAYDNALPVLKSNGQVGTFYIITGGVDNAPGFYLTSKEIKKMADEGMEIGSHTMSHPDLAATNLVDSDKQLVDSKKFLEQVTGAPVNHFCYPSGKYNNTVTTQVQKAGYVSAVTTHSKGSFDDSLTLPRIRISPGLKIGDFANILKNF